MNVKKLKVKSKKLKVLLVMFLLTPLFALNISVTILPQKGVVKAIGGDKVNVNVMVPPGNSPATYTPNFKQLKELKNSDIYFTIGVPFDKKYLSKIKEINPNIKIVYFGSFIKTTNNPHIWLSPALLQLEAKVVLDTLITNDSKNKTYYLNNYKHYIKTLANLEVKGLETIRQKAFITFHPSFYYFAKDFHINQIAIQKEGKSPSFAYLAKIIKLAKKENVKTVIISPEFPTKYAKIVAAKIGAKVAVISPLNPKPENTINQLIEALK
ncbi:MAG: zinc ABC transporter substrate-binding protein [Nautiliaceae bacterium]|jgi:zinc transport system substrate-binding protein